MNCITLSVTCITLYLYSYISNASYVMAILLFLLWFVFPLILT
jgi:hypothetical protein